MGVKNYVLVGLGLFLVAVVFGNFVSAQVNISVGDYFVDPGTSTITVPINISNCSGIGSGQFYIYYNGFTGSGTNPGFNPLNASSVFSFNNYDGMYTPVSPSHPVIDIHFGINKGSGCVLANIVFNISATQIGKRSDIRIDVVSLKDPSGNTLSYITSNGSVTIACNSTNCPSGTTCDTTTTHLCQATTITCYADADNDSYGNATNTITNTTCPSGYVNNSLDCNDNDNLTHPGANESIYGINGKDENCNNITDDCSPTNSSINGQPSIYCNASGQMDNKKGFNETCSGNYACVSGNCTNGHCAGYVYCKDNDNDNFSSNNMNDCNVSSSDLGNNSTICGGVTCYLTTLRPNTDCNDSNNLTNPRAIEIYNGIDDNCDSLTDEGFCNNETHYNSTICPGWSCNDNIHYCNSTTHSIQSKNGVNVSCSQDYECLSNNCTSGKCAGYLCYRDVDGDGFGNATNYNVSNNATCPTGYVNNSNDCNDNNSAINPNTVWYFDNDNDNYGNATNHVTSCTKQSGNLVLNNKDCNDNNSYVNPGMTEKTGWSYLIIGNTTNTTVYTSSDGIDNDCDGIIDEQCHIDTDCGSNYYCSGYTCHEKSTTTGYTGVVDLSSGSSTTTTTATTILKECYVSDAIPSEIDGLTFTLNLGKNASGADVITTVGNKTSKSTANVNGTVTITLSGYGQGEITISKSGCKNLTKTITVYAGTLNITKVSGEKYGDEFKFKVTTKDGNPVKDANVEIYGKTLKTDASGIVKMTITTIQQGLEASASTKNYKGSSASFDVQAIGTLKVDGPEKVTKGDTITITITDENNNPVPSAKVTINGVEQTADANGKIEYKVTTDSLTLKAENEGYIPSEQTSVTVEAKIECGNGKCEAGETKENCPSDCIICGDNVCDTGENYENCANDCPKPSDNTLLIIVGILLVILLIAAYYFLVMRKKKGGEEESK